MQPKNVAVFASKRMSNSSKMDDDETASIERANFMECNAAWYTALLLELPGSIVCNEGLEMVEKLILHGYPLPAWLVKDRLADISPHDGAWALVRAKVQNLEEAFDLMRSAGISYFARNSEGDTLLHVAIRENRLDFVRLLVDVEPRFMKKINRDWLTPIHLSAKLGNLEVVEFLISRGSEPHWRTEGSRNVLHIAAENNHAELMRFLVGKGARIDETDRHGFTALHTCAKNGHIEGLQALLEYGAKLEMCDVFGDSPLLVAVKYNHPECLRALVDAGASVNVKTGWGDTPVHHGPNHVLTA